MSRARNCHRKRPTILPPLPNLEPFARRPINFLQPPDLLLTENRLGSPRPKWMVPVKPDSIFTTNDEKITITKHEACLKDAEKYNMKTNLLSNEIFDEGNNNTQQIKKIDFFSRCEMGSESYDGVNPFLNNFSKKQQFDCFRDGQDKKNKTQEVLPLEKTENLKTFEFKVLQIPNRFKPLKPIGQTTNANNL